MFEENNKPVDPRFGVNVPRSNGARTKAAKSFQFAITWTSLTAHLELRDSAELMTTRAEESQKTQLVGAAFAAAATPALIPRQETRSDAGARWEMVVPKMVRADRFQSQLTEVTPPAQYGAEYMPISIPPTHGSRNPLAPSLSKVLAAIAQRTRSLLAGPIETVNGSPTSFLDASRIALASGRSSRLQALQLNAPGFAMLAGNQIAKIEDSQDRHAVREMLLSKISSALLRRTGQIDPTFATNHQEERWTKVPAEDEPEAPYSL